MKNFTAHIQTEKHGVIGYSFKAKDRDQAHVFAKEALDYDKIVKITEEVTDLGDIFKRYNLSDCEVTSIRKYGDFKFFVYKIPGMLGYLTTSAVNLKGEEIECGGLSHDDFYTIVEKANIFIYKNR